MNKTLYQDLIENGITGITNHESDLYFPVTPESTAILSKHPTLSDLATSFKDNQGQLCYDVPFAYDPYWADKRKAYIKRFGVNP